MRIILLLACVALLVSDSYAQRDKKSKKAKATPTQQPVPTPIVSRLVMIDLDGNELTPEQSARLAMYPRTVLQPEPLIGIHYLLSYPKEAVEGKVQGTVTYTVKVRDGNVIDAKIERPDNMYLTSAVLEAANRLQFDKSWHQPDKPEFSYTRSVEFRLPDQIHSLMPPLVFEKQ
jgi:TonB family protein